MFGWTHWEILKLTYKQFWAYRKQAGSIIAIEQLRAMEAAIYPYINDKDRQKLRSEYMKIADDTFEERQVKDSMLQLKAMKAQMKQHKKELKHKNRGKK